MSSYNSSVSINAHLMFQKRVVRFHCTIFRKASGAVVVVIILYIAVGFTTTYVISAYHH